MLKQLSVIAIALLATQAHAAVASKPFVEFGFGQSSYSEACSETSVFGGNSTCDDKDSFVRLGAGIMITPTLSAEVSYLNFGEATYQESDSSTRVNVAIETQALAFQVGAYAPLTESVNVYGKLGFAYAQLKVNASGTDPGGSVILSSDESELEVVATAGASYNFMPNLGLNLQLDYIPGVGSEDSGEEDVLAVSVGLKYQF